MPDHYVELVWLSERNLGQKLETEEMIKKRKLRLGRCIPSTITTMTTLTIMQRLLTSVRRSKRKHKRKRND